MDDIDNTPIEDLKGTIEFIKDCVLRHVGYAIRPKWCNEDVGSMIFHKNCTDRYWEILQVLYRLEDNAKGGSGEQSRSRQKKT